MAYYNRVQRFVLRHTDSRRHNLPLRTILVVALPVAFCSLWTAVVQLPDNVLELSQTSPPARILISAFPQGWAFFTRSPQEEQFRAYANEPPLRSLSLSPYSEPHNAFGLDRGPRKQAAELAAILSKVENSDWRLCTSDTDCIGANDDILTVDNPMQGPTYCGLIRVVGSKIVPWGYRDLVPATYQSVRSIHLQVRCLP